MQNLIHKITIQEWNYFSKTNSIKFIKKHGVTEKNIEEFTTIVRENLGEIQDFAKEKNKINSKFKIHELITYYRNIHHLLVHKTKVELWLLELGIEVDANEKLNETINAKTKKLFEKYQIKIESLSDMAKLDREINRRLEKYAELTKEKETVKEGVTFIEIVIGVFKVHGFDKIDYEMVLSDFFELKNTAAKIAKKWQN